MAAVGDDCYFYYYSSCAKGSRCLYRHCEAARGNETTCTSWQSGSCFRPNCRFRHMEIKMDRSQIPCFWENQPVGCTKPHCAFKHFKPRPFSSALSQSGSRSPVAPSSPEDGQQIASGHSSPIVQPVIIPMIDSDVESAGTASTAGTPIKSKPRPVCKSPPSSKLAAAENESAKTQATERQTKQHVSSANRHSPPLNSEGFLRSGRSSPSSVRSSPPPSRPQHDFPPSRVESESKNSPVRCKTIQERLGNRIDVSASSLNMPEKCPSVISLKSIKLDQPEVHVMSLEETLRQRALESMMRAREQAAAAGPVLDPPVEHDEPQVDCRRVVVDSETEQEEPQTPVQEKKSSACVSVRNRLGARVVPRKALLKTKNRLAPPTLHKVVGRRYDEPHHRRRNLSASNNSDYSEEESDFSDDFSADRVKAPLVLKKRLNPVTSPEHLSDQGQATKPSKKKSIPAAYFEDLSDEPVTTLPRKKSQKKKAAPITNLYDSSDNEAVSVKKKKSARLATAQPEDFSDEDKPIKVPVKKRLNLAALPKVARQEAPVTVTFLREPERLELVKSTITSDKPLKKKLADRLGSHAKEQKLLKKRLIADSVVSDRKQLKLLMSTEKDTESPRLKPVKKLKARSEPVKKITIVSTTEKPKEQNKPAEDVTAKEDKPSKKLVVRDAIEEWKRLKKQMANHVLNQPLEKPRRKITLITEQEEKCDSTKGDISKSPQVLSLEEIRRRKMLKQQAESSDQSLDSEKEKSVVPIVSLLEIKRRKLQKETRSQQIYDISLFTDRGEAEKPKAMAGEPRVLSLEDIRKRKQLKQQQEGHENISSKRVTPPSARRSKAEVQIYVPPPRKKAAVSFVKEEIVSPPRDNSVVKKRLGKPSSMTTREEEPVALKARLQEKPTAVRAGAREMSDGGAVVVKTFSEIMAEKRKKRQLERQPQQNTAINQQENDSGADASKKLFRFQPVVFADSESESNSPKRIGGFSRADKNVSPVTVSQKLSPSQQEQSTVRFRLGSANPSNGKVSANSNAGMGGMTKPSASYPCLSELSDSSKVASGPSKTSASVVNPLHHSISMPFIAPLAPDVSVPSCAQITVPSASISLSVIPTVHKVSQPPPLTSQQPSVTTMCVSPLSSQPQPAVNSSKSTVVSLNQQQSMSTSGKAADAESRRPSIHLATTDFLSKSQDDLLLTEPDAVLLDDGDELDDLLMDIDSLLE